MRGIRPVSRSKHLSIDRALNFPVLPVKDVHLEIGECRHGDLQLSLRLLSRKLYQTPLHHVSAEMRPLNDCAHASIAFGSGTISAVVSERKSRWRPPIPNTSHTVTGCSIPFALIAVCFPSLSVEPPPAALFRRSRSARLSYKIECARSG